MVRRPVDFERQTRRSRFEAWLLHGAAEQVHREHGRRKSDVIGSFRGTVVEIGPGTGVNMRYYAPGVHVIAIEPNPVMHPRLEQQARRHGVDLEIRTRRGEHIDVDDGVADAVVATLVLCGVDEPGRVIAEARRVLRPGGTFFFHEHIAAPAGTLTRRIQAIVKRPHRWIFNGCEVDRETADLLTSAGFGHVELAAVDSGASGLYVRHQIIGTAVR